MSLGSATLEPGCARDPTNTTGSKRYVPATAVTACPDRRQESSAVSTIPSTTSKTYSQSIHVSRATW